MIRLALWTAAGVMIGLIVHIAALLAVPRIATRTAFLRLEALGPANRFIPVAGDGASPLPSPDPAVRMAVCRYDLAQGPLHIRAAVGPSFSSLSLYTPDALGFYALTDRAAADGVIDLTLYTDLQLADVRSRLGPDTPDALRVEAPTPRGLAVLRLLVAAPSLGAETDRRVGEAACAPA